MTGSLYSLIVVPRLPCTGTRKRRFFPERLTERRPVNGMSPAVAEDQQLNHKPAHFACFDDLRVIAAVLGRAHGPRRPTASSGPDFVVRRQR